jgi:hypothetical protein
LAVLQSVAKANGVEWRAEWDSVGRQDFELGKISAMNEEKSNDESDDILVIPKSDGLCFRINV